MRLPYGVTYGLRHDPYGCEEHATTNNITFFWRAYMRRVNLN